MNGISKIIYIVAEYLVMFMLASFIGWCYEIVCVYVVYGQYYDRGILHLPLCPIYGFGMLLLNLVLNKVKSSMLILVSSILVTTSLEYATACIAEYKFHVIMWTYEGWPLNFQNKISAISSCAFGLMALLFFKVIKPLVRKVYVNNKLYVSCLAFAIFAICLLWEIHFLR